MNLKKIGKVFMSKFVGTGPSSYKEKNLPGRSLTNVEKHWYKSSANAYLKKRASKADREIRVNHEFVFLRRVVLRVRVKMNLTVDTVK